MTSTQLLQHPYYDRFKDILSDPTNRLIERKGDAGQVNDGLVTMYNGLKVYSNCYYDNFSDIFWLNEGVHEPQEEFVFQEVLKSIRTPMPTMLELGSYWAFYSMSFMQKFPNGKAYCVEADPNYMYQGQRNFELNEMSADFTCGYVGDNAITVDGFCQEKNIDRLDILHADIQSFELQMLYGAPKMIGEHRIDNIFVSTHTQELHYECLRILQNYDYKIATSVDLNESFCCDGIIVAQSKNVPYMGFGVFKKGNSPLFTDTQMLEHLQNVLKKKNPLR
jgi:hypothetical protein